MFPAKSAPVLASSTTISPHTSREGMALRVVRRLGPIILALLLAWLIAGCASAPRGDMRPSTGAEAAPAYRIVLPAQGTSSLKVGLPLSARDLRVGKISILVEWSTAATGCAIRLSSRVASRSGRGRPTTEGDEAGEILPSDASDLLWADEPADATYVKPYVLALRKDPRHGSGEVLTLEFMRDPDAAQDTCESDLVITAVHFGAGAEMAARVMHWLRDDRSLGKLTLSGMSTATLKPR